jgi:undecaprenyl diphosphate synthase
LWPDFDEAELAKALHWYAARHRRFGLVGEQLKQKQKESV